MSPAFERALARLKFRPHRNLAASQSGDPQSGSYREDEASGERSPAHISFGHYLLWGVACILPLLALFVQVKHWVNIPIWDEWDTPGIVLVHAAQHQLPWADLIAQHNESRKVFPRFIYLALAGVFGWDVRHGMLLTLLCAGAASVFFLLYLRTPDRRLIPSAILPWLLANALLFGPMQYENFLCGNAFEIFVPLLALFGCIAINLSERPIWSKTGWNSLLALVATYTFAHGMILWALAAPMPNRAEWQTEGRLRRLGVAYLAYGLAAAGAIGCYFIGYYRPEIAPSPATPSQWPQLIEFMLVWLGSVLRSTSVNPRVPGALLGLVLLAAATVSLVLMRRGKIPWERIYPWFVLAAFSLGSGAATAVGRLNIGIEAVFETGFVGVSSFRYHITASFAYIAAVGLVWSLYQEFLQSQKTWRFRLSHAATAGIALFAVAWILALATERERLPAFEQNRTRARLAVMWSAVLPENPDLSFAYPYTPNFSQRIAEMRSLGVLQLPEISPKIAAAIRALPETSQIDAGNLDSGSVSGVTEFRVTGWARIPRRNVPADTVILGWDENGVFHPFLAVPTGQRRPDVAEVFKLPALRNAGFDHRFDISRLPRQALRIRAWAIDSINEEVFPVHGSILLPARPGS